MQNKIQLIIFQVRRRVYPPTIHNLLPIFANLLATPNITAFVNSPLSMVHASAMAPPTTNSFGTFFPDGFSSFAVVGSLVSISCESVDAFSKYFIRLVLTFECICAM
ncbi:hypothetical protein Hanom_Chr03g00262311 [Helianthus anomalus]